MGWTNSKISSRDDPSLLQGGPDPSCEPVNEAEDYPSQFQDKGDDLEVALPVLGPDHQGFRLRFSYSGHDSTYHPILHDGNTIYLITQINGRVWTPP